MKNFSELLSNLGKPPKLLHFWSTEGEISFGVPIFIIDSPLLKLKRPWINNLFINKIRSIIRKAGKRRYSIDGTFCEGPQNSCIL